MTSRELTSGFDLWSCGHGRDAYTYLYPIRSYWHFPEIKDGGRRHLRFVGEAMGPPTKAYSWCVDCDCVLPVKISSWSAKWFSSYKDLNFLSLRLESPIQAPEILVLPPKFRGTSFRPPKRHFFAWVHVFWAITRQNPSTGLTCTRVWEKKSTGMVWPMGTVP